MLVGGGGQCARELGTAVGRRRIGHTHPGSHPAN